MEGDCIRIIKKRRLFAARRERLLPICNITSVEVKKPGLFVAGFIQFSIAGGVARDTSFTITGGAWDAIQDENSVVFGGRRRYRSALEIKHYIQKYSEGKSSSSAHSTSAADEILKLKNLLDKGILTRAEFDAKKKELLGI